MSRTQTLESFNQQIKMRTPIKRKKSKRKFTTELVGLRIKNLSK